MKQLYRKTENEKTKEFRFKWWAKMGLLFALGAKPGFAVGQALWGPGRKDGQAPCVYMKNIEEQLYRSFKMMLVTWVIAWRSMSLKGSHMFMFVA